MPSRTRPYREALLEALADPVEAAHYLSAAIGDSPDMFLKALRNVAQARHMSKVAKAAGVTRESLYRATSLTGNPTLDTLASVLNALGLQIKIEALARSSTHKPAHNSSIRTRARVHARAAKRSVTRD
jgi:probable addiction module antidote protein